MMITHKVKPLQATFSFGNESQSTQEISSSSHNTHLLPLNLKSHKPREQNGSYDSMTLTRTPSSISPLRKSMAMYSKADLNDFTKGISDMKVAYIPSFGHEILDFNDGPSMQDKWRSISRNILNFQAPIHSAILEIVQNQQLKEKQMILKQKQQSLPRPKESDANLQRQKSIKAPQRKLTLKTIQEQTSFDVEKEILSKLRWWKYGSKDDDEHLLRKTRSDFHIKILDLKVMGMDSEELLKEHKSSQNFYQSFKKQQSPVKTSNYATNQQQQEKRESLSKTPYLKIGQIDKRDLQKQRNSSIFSKQSKQSYLQKIQKQGHEKRKYFDTYLPSPRANSSQTNYSQFKRFNSQNNPNLLKVPTLKTQESQVSSILLKDLNQDLSVSLPKSSMVSPSFFHKRNLKSTVQSPKVTETEKQRATNSQQFQTQLNSPKSRSRTEPFNTTKSNTFSSVKSIYDKEVEFIKLRKEKHHKEWKDILEIKLKDNYKNQIRNSSQFNNRSIQIQDFKTHE